MPKNLKGTASLERCKHNADHKKRDVDTKRDVITKRETMDNLAKLQLVCLIHPDPELIEPRMAVTVLGIAVAALIDTSASLSLSGAYLIERCKEQKANLHKTNVRLELASGPEMLTSHAVRLQIGFNEKKRRQHFVCSRGLTVPLIVGLGCVKLP